MKCILIGFLSSFFFFSQTNPVKQFHWLEGTWKLDGKEAYERWQAIDDTTLGALGYHYEAEEDDTSHMEVVMDEPIRLISRGDKFFYIPAPHNQNKGKEVEFEIISFTKNSFVAENPKHDFPTRIVYKLKDAKHLDAYIEGKEKNKSKRIDFHFTKAEQ